MKYLLLLLISTQAFPCGTERWNVKVGSDADASRINLSNIVSITVGAMGLFPKPAKMPANNRVAPYELTVYEVSAQITRIAKENDGDFHLVLTSNGSTMIAEVPELDCVSSSSPLYSGIASAANTLDGIINSGMAMPVAVIIRGVGFFDFPHGQTGKAPNYIELHPVIGINVGTQIHLKDVNLKKVLK